MLCRVCVRLCGRLRAPDQITRSVRALRGPRAAQVISRRPPQQQRQRPSAATTNLRLATKHAPKSSTFLQKPASDDFPTTQLARKRYECGINRPHMCGYVVVCDVDAVWLFAYNQSQCARPICGAVYIMCVYVWCHGNVLNGCDHSHRAHTRRRHECVLFAIYIRTAPRIDDLSSAGCAECVCACVCVNKRVCIYSKLSYVRSILKRLLLVISSRVISCACRAVSCCVF